MSRNGFAWLLSTIVATVGFEARAAASGDESPPLSLLTDSLNALQGPSGFLLTGKVSSKEPDSSAGASVLVFTAGQSGEEFKGDMEAWRTDQGELLLVSRDALPGMAVYEKGERLLVTTTHEEEPIAAREVSADLTSLLKLDRVVASLESAKVQSEADPSGKSVFRAALPARLVRSATMGASAMIEPKVLRIEAVFTLDAKKNLESVRFSVLRSDPFSGMRERALSGGLESGTVTMSGGEDLSGNAEGKTSVYELAPGSKPSARADAVLKTMRGILKSEAR